ncbi:hypothetical protein GW17_00034911 [Ensete ventricosum]|nr:hypothetical protein GW17_00034911 [Ensete ventricosum]
MPMHADRLCSDHLPPAMGRLTSHDRLMTSPVIVLLAGGTPLPLTSDLHGYHDTWLCICLLLRNHWEPRPSVFGSDQLHPASATIVATNSNAAIVVARSSTTTIVTRSGPAMAARRSGTI